jgi:hypothetical protein
MLRLSNSGIDNYGIYTSRYKSPILRVQKKNALKKQNSMKDLNSNLIANSLEIGQFPKKSHYQKEIIHTGKNLARPQKLNKSNSISSYNQFLLKNEKYNKNKIPIKRLSNSTLKSLHESKNSNTINVTINNYTFKKCNLKKKYIPRTQPNHDYIGTSRGHRKSKIKNDYYCINCYNRKLMLKNKKNPFNNVNKSYNPNYFYKTLELKKLDEDYIYNKVLQNEEKQLKAFNHLKQQKDKKSNKEKLQYINENEDNPFIGLNLQEYLYYNNKKKNEQLNNTMIDNINSYNLDRKAVRDYYDVVQYQIPILEKDFGPSNKYKVKYIETLKKQMDDKIKEKNENRRLKIETEIEENKKLNEYLKKLKNDENRQKALKQKMIYDNNKFMEEFINKQKENKKKESIDGKNEKMRKFNKNQIDYKKFINQQRINEINSLQKWLNENMNQKKKQKNDEMNEQKKWDNYNKEYIRTFYDNTYAEKCANCNATYPIDKLYPLPKSVVS